MKTKAFLLAGVAGIDTDGLLTYLVLHRGSFARCSAHGTEMSLSCCWGHFGKYPQVINPKKEMMYKLKMPSQDQTGFSLRMGSQEENSCAGQNSQAEKLQDLSFFSKYITQGISGRTPREPGMCSLNANLHSLLECDGY